MTRFIGDKSTYYTCKAIQPQKVKVQAIFKSSNLTKI